MAARARTARKRTLTAPIRPVVVTNGRGRGGGDGGRGPGPFPPGTGPHAQAARILIWLLVAAIAMLFVGFTSAYLVRRQQPDWGTVPLPGLLWVNTALLLLSSGTVEWARRMAHRGQRERAVQGLAWTLALSVAFVAGQLLAWGQLAAAGVFMRTNPHSGFFYLLSGAHALHVLGGVAVLLYALVRIRRGSAGVALTADLAAVYWHFVDGLWIYLFALLYAL